MKSGKNLQEIYDEGISKLEKVKDEIQAGCTSEAHKIEAACQKREATMRADLEAELSSHVDDIARYAGEAKETIKAAIDLELEANKRVLESVRDRTLIRLEALQKEIEQFGSLLGQHTEGQLEHYGQLLHGNSEQLAAAVQQHNLKAAESAKQLAQETVRELDESANTSITTMLNELVRYPQELSQLYRAQYAQTDKAVRSGEEALATTHREACNRLRSLCQELNVAIEQSAAAGAQELSAAYADYESRQNSAYEAVLSDGLSSQSATAEQLMHEFHMGLRPTREELSARLSELQAETGSRADQVRQLVACEDFAAREKAQEIESQFRTQEVEKIELAMKQQDRLANERNELMDRVQNDLTTMESEFATRLGQLSRQCLEKLSSTCVEAELAIAGTHDHCKDEFKSIAENLQQNIEVKTEALLRQIEEVQSAAVSRIRAAAGHIAHETGSPGEIDKQEEE